MRGYFKNRRFIYILAGLIILIAGMIGLIISFSVTTKELEKLRNQYKEMRSLKDEFLSVRDRIDALERKEKLTKINDIIPAVEDVFSSLGLRNKIKSIMPAGNREVSGSIEVMAEVSVEKVSMNEMINLFYKIENAPMLLVLKKADIKTSFERPELLNLILMISLIHEK